MRGIAGLVALLVSASACALPAEHLVPSQVLFEEDGTPAILITSDIGEGTIRRATGPQTLDAVLVRFWSSTHPTALKPDGSFDVVSVEPGFAMLQAIDAATLSIREQIDIDPRFLSHIAPEFSYRPGVQHFGSYRHANCDALSSESVDWVVDVARHRVLFVGKPPPHNPLTAACFATPSGELRYIRNAQEGQPELELCTFAHSRPLDSWRRLCDARAVRLRVEGTGPLPQMFTFLTAENEYVLSGPDGVAVVHIPPSCWDGQDFCETQRAAAEFVTTFASLNIIQISVAPDASEFLLFEYGGCNGRSTMHWFVRRDAWSYQRICASPETFAAGALGDGRVVMFSGDNSHIGTEFLSLGASNGR